jgi:WD40 repeat protein
MSDTILTPSHRTAGPAPKPPAVPDHELLRRIGQGAYGEVWLARNVMGTWRAVKVVYRRTFQDDRPFEREFEGIRKFEPVSRSQPSQVNILHVGRNEAEGYFYYVMELGDDQARGQEIDPASYAPRTLKSELLFRGHLPAAECVRLALDLTTALEHLHAHGLVHRDIKPANIIFVNGQPKLADIGLVAQAEATMSFVGTEGYVPPEGPGTVQADLYSLGKVLYEIATGRDRQEFPELPTRLGASPAEEAELLELNEVFLKACDHEVKRRYASAQEMHADLALLQAGESVARLRNTERRLRFVQRAGALVTAIAALAAGLYLWQARQTHIVQGLVAEKTRLIEEKGKLADANREQLVRLRVANGVRLMDGGDLSGSRILFEEAGGGRSERYLASTDLGGSLLWLAEALPLVAHLPAEAEIHRIRIQSVRSSMPVLLQVVAHNASIPAGAFSPDGRRIATGSSDGELRVWDVETAQPIFPPLQLGRRILSVRFSRDGRRLVVRSTSDTGLATIKETAAFALVLDASTGKRVFPGITNAVKTAYSPDDRWLAAARTDFSVQAFDASTGRPVVELTGHTGEITSLAFSADGSRLLTGSRDRTARLWRMPSGEQEGPPLSHEGAVARAAISPDGRRIAIGTEPVGSNNVCQICLWDSKTGAPIGPPLKAQGSVSALVFDRASGRRLFTGDDRFRLQAWDIETQAEAFPSLRVRSPGGCDWAFSPDGGRFAVGSFDYDAYVWSPTTGELLLPPLKHNGFVLGVAFSPDGTRLLTTSDDGAARVWGIKLSVDTEPWLRMEAPIVGAVLSEDGNQLLVALQEGTIRRINLATMREESPPMPALGSNSQRGLAFDRSGHQWAAALAPYEGNGQSHSVGLWRQESNQIRHRELPHSRAVVAVSFDPTGSRLVTVADDVSIRVWKTADASLVREVSLPGRDFAWAEVAPDARTAVVALRHASGASRELRLLNLETGQPFGTVIHEADGLDVVAFSPESRRLAVASYQSGRIWDALTGKPLTPPFKHGGRLLSVAWSPDGQRVTTAGLSDLGKIWEAATGRPLLASMWSANFRKAYFSNDGRFVEELGDDGHVRLWDASTTEVLTSRWQLEGDLRIARVTASNRLVVVSGNAIRSRNVQPNTLPATVLAEAVQVLAGRRLDAAGVMHPIPAVELARLQRSLRARAPELFDYPPEKAPLGGTSYTSP